MTALSLLQTGHNREQRPRREQIALELGVRTRTRTEGAQIQLAARVGSRIQSIRIGRWFCVAAVRASERACRLTFVRSLQFGDPTRVECNFARKHRLLYYTLATGPLSSLALPLSLSPSLLRPSGAGELAAAT